MHVNAGRLNQRIQILRVDRVYDDAGYFVPQYENIHCCWAQVSPQSGTEKAKANADFGEEKVRFLIRWTGKPIDRKMLVRYRGKDYEIEYINDYGRPGQYMEIWGTWRSKEAD